MCCERVFSSVSLCVRRVLYKKQNTLLAVTMHLAALIHGEMFSYSVKPLWHSAQVANECIAPMHLGDL